MSDTMTNAPRRRGRPARTADVNIENGAASVNTAETAPAAVVERSAMRPPVREEDPRARAAARAAQIKGHLGELDEGVDDFITPPPPPGWTYEWKRKTIYNQEDPAYQVSLARTGWEPVPASRHPEMMPSGGSHANIERKGMILMERPLAVTEKFREADRRKAIQQVRFKEEQLSSAPQGHFDRDHPQARPNIKKGYEPMPIPD